MNQQSLFSHQSENVNIPEPNSLEELLFRANALKNQKLGHLYGIAFPKKEKTIHKGFTGQLIEKILGANPKAMGRPDFLKIGIELKTLPISSLGKPLETTFCTKVDFKTLNHETWEESRLYKKTRKVLWVPYLKHKNPMENIIGTPIYWEPSHETNSHLKNDWELLMGALAMGRIPNASEGQWVQLRPKAKNSLCKELLTYSGGSFETLPLGFYLKTNLTHFIISNFS